MQISSLSHVRRRWWPVRVYLPLCVVSRASRGVELCAYTTSYVTSLPPTRYALSTDPKIIGFVVWSTSQKPKRTVSDVFFGVLCV